MEIPDTPRTWATDDWVTSTALNDDYYRAMRLLMNRPAAGAWLSTDQTISASTYTIVELDRVLFDTDGLWDADRNGFMIQTPGTYEVQCFVRFDNPSSAEVAVRLLINNGGVDGPMKNWSPGVGVEVAPYATVFDEHAFVEGDYVQVQAWQGTGGDWDLQGYDDPSYYGIRCHMSLYWTGISPARGAEAGGSS